MTDETPALPPVPIPADALPPEFWQGVEQFNQGEFYACHDSFEALWTEAHEPDRTFYQGLLQLAVGLYHLGNHNWQGAATLLGEAIGRLRPYDDNYGGIALAPLRAQAKVIWLLLHETGRDQVADLAQRLGLGVALQQTDPLVNPGQRVALPRIIPDPTPL